MSINIHASCVSIGGRGVLLLGPSGSGKSDLALRLVDEGAKLVTDDACELFVRARKLYARPPHAIAGLLEMRGIGIIALPHANSAAVALAVRLGTPRTRLPEPAFYSSPLGPQVPLIMVKPDAASAPARIRAALAAFVEGRFRDTFNPPNRT